MFLRGATLAQGESTPQLQQQVRDRPTRTFLKQTPSGEWEASSDRPPKRPKYSGGIAYVEGQPQLAMTGAAARPSWVAAQILYPRPDETPSRQLVNRPLSQHSQMVAGGGAAGAAVVAPIGYSSAFAPVKNKKIIIFFI